MKDYWWSLVGVLIGVAGMWLLLSIAPTTQQNVVSSPIAGKYYVRMLKTNTCLPGKVDIGQQLFPTIRLLKLVDDYYKIVDFGNINKIENIQIKNGYFSHQWANTFYKAIKMEGRAFNGKINFILRFERHVDGELVCINHWHGKGKQIVSYPDIEKFSKNITSDMGYYDGLMDDAGLPRKD